jgi:AcrR family transcriptional regulator
MCIPVSRSAIITRQANPNARLPLTRERILWAAIAVADASGIESLTMRKLGQALGVEAMSLYNHVANKNDMLSGMIDLVNDEIDLPAEGGEWKQALRAIAISAYRAYRRHAWVCEIMLGPEYVSSARFRYMEALLGCMRKAGFSADLTHHGYHALDSHITGFTLWVATINLSTDDLAELGVKFLKDFPRNQFPYVAEHIDLHIEEAKTGHGSGVSEFEFGLDLILDGLERLRDAG